MKKTYLVSYVDNSSPKMKKFKSLKSVNSFVDKFYKHHGRNEYNGYWVDWIIEASNLKIHFKTDFTFGLKQ